MDATKVVGRDKVIQLLECCDEPLRKDLTRAASGSLTDKTEAEVLTAIRKLAVREENTMVARVTLHNMRQDREETVRSFGARIRGQADICRFTIKCPGCDADVNYTDAIMRDVLSRGLVDPEIQMDLLGDKNQEMSLEDVFQFVEAKEAGKRSASRLLDSVEAATFSSYKKTKQHKPNKADNDSELCSYCGKRGHGKQSTARIRRTQCPAYGHRCEHCKREHHFESVCRSKDDVYGRSKDYTARKARRQPPRDPDHENAVFDALCTLFDQSSREVDPTMELFDLSSRDGGPTMDNVCSVTRGNHTIPLDHHVYDNKSDTWVRRSSKPQPFINVTVQTHSQDYAELGFGDKHISSLSVSVSAMADTGCQSCLAGLKVIHRLGLRESDLLPVTMRMHTANDDGIQILGAILLGISSTDNTGHTVETRQMTYVTDSTDKLFLSREACVALGIISESFPQVHAINTYNTANVHDHIAAPCGCPVRRPPPPLPSDLPFPASDTNRGKLQEYLLDYYKSSTFNTCDHQQLPLMDCPPMKLMVDPNAKPVAHHTPVPVPLHWREDVKAGLDQDVRLGVLEQVPIGDPVTWCHRMVVCAKKTGKPRRTVDFQALNVHATRETHHTPSPFLQARSVPAGKKKTVFDAWNGYHSVPICEEDRHLTTFITPWGRYRYKTAPQGYIASGDGYTRRYDEIVADIPNKTKCVDDALLWSDTLEESFHQAAQWLDVCGRNGIVLNPDKFVFGADTVEFAGFEISLTDVRPCQRYLRAILDFPTPKDITDVRSWFGLVNQVSYAFSMAERMLPFRELLKP
ncbi:MAG: reverse transcriptase family protein, partial [Candidatus Thiodiazotropha endolucinida]|nr:reverse transcriptase family protein [Candidatus Thiodiazotropha taylori]MCW4342105.1 reverse transcriptase family protein [Candidatus Thiodiazotropha endolucinida]